MKKKVKNNQLENEKTQIPEKYQLPVLFDMEKLEQEIRKDSEAKKEGTIELIKSRVAEIEKVDDELKSKVQILSDLKEEYRGIFAGFGKLQKERDAKVEQQSSKTKMGEISFQEFESEQKKIDQEYQSRKESLEKRVGFLEQMIREKDHEIKQLEFNKSEAVFEIRRLAVQTAQAALSLWKKREENIKRKVSEAAAFRIEDVQTDLKFHRLNFKNDSLVSPLILVIPKGDLWETILDSRIPDSYLPEVKKIIEDASSKEQAITITLLPSGHASGEKVRVIYHPKIEVRKNE